MNTSVVPAGMPMNGSESIRGDNGCCCQGYNGTRDTMSSQVQVPLIIDIETDLPNGNYIESNGASGGFTCKCSAETLYSTATEMAIAKQQETINQTVAMSYAGTVHENNCICHCPNEWVAI